MGLSHFTKGVLAQGGGGTVRELQNSKHRHYGEGFRACQRRLGRQVAPRGARRLRHAAGTFLRAEGTPTLPLPRVGGGGVSSLLACYPDQTLTGGIGGGEGASQLELSDPIGSAPGAYLRLTQPTSWRAAVIGGPPWMSTAMLPQTALGGGCIA